MKDIEIGPIRPPSESNSLLIRVTRGCPGAENRLSAPYLGSDQSELS